MAESTQDWYERVAAEIARNGYRETEDITTWEVWPWRKDGSVKDLNPPEEEKPRRGIDGVDCYSCERGRTLEGAIWADDLYYVTVAQDSSLPFAAFLMPRRHADLATLTAEEAARQGEVLAGIERAAMATTCVPRIQVARWGDGGEHLHWWLYGRPAGMNQLRGTALALWDDELPARPAEMVAEDAIALAAALVDELGGQALV